LKADSGVEVVGVMSVNEPQSWLKFNTPIYTRLMEQDTIIVFLLIVIGVLFVNELRRQWRERNAATLNDKEKANAIMHTLNLQAEVINSLDDRVNTLGEAVGIVIKILDSEQKKKGSEHDDQIKTKE
jgi:hypothetical protein